MREFLSNDRQAVRVGSGLLGLREASIGGGGGAAGVVEVGDGVRVEKGVGERLSGQRRGSEQAKNMPFTLRFYVAAASMNSSFRLAVL